LSEKPQTNAEEIRESLGAAIDQIEVFHNQVLVGIYIKPERSAGGVYFTPTTIDEDKWQGKIGLVLKKGPMAFQNDARNDFHGLTIEEGEWVLFRVSDAHALKVNDVFCRIVEDIHIRGRVATPEIIY
jgi:hypothetical protein